MIDRPALDWKLGGLALGVVFFLAVALVKPIGVSTKSVFEKGHGQCLIRVADAAMVMSVSATPASCS